MRREFDDYLQCGRLEHGFLRVRCDTCHADHLVAFSCKRRGFCPSCGARRMAESATLLMEEVFPEQPVRQMGGALARHVGHLLQPQLPWRTLLAHYMTAIARNDYSYMRPSRREGSAILSSLRGSQIDLAVALDISGSITNVELEEFVAEVNAIKGQIQARITLHACDAALAQDGPWTFEPWEEAQLPATLKGGGGTSFVPMFEWLGGHDRAPDLLVYFTDADGEFPTREPAFPVLWLVKGKRPVPWGQRLQLNLKNCLDLNTFVRHIEHPTR